MSNFSKRKFKQAQFNSFSAEPNLTADETPNVESVEQNEDSSYEHSVTENEQEQEQETSSVKVVEVSITPTPSLQFEEAERRRRRLLGYN